MRWREPSGLMLARSPRSAYLLCSATQATDTCVTLGERTEVGANRRIVPSALASLPRAKTQRNGKHLEGLLPVGVGREKVGWGWPAGVGRKRAAHGGSGETKPPISERRIELSLQGMSRPRRPLRSPV